MKEKKDSRIIEQDGQKYLRIGDKAIPFDDYDDNGKPIIKPKVEVKTHPDGRRDTTIKVPALTIRTKGNLSNEKYDE